MSKRFDLPKDLDRLTPQQRVLLEKLLQKEGLTVLQFPIIPQSGDRTALPLSFAQQRLWFFDQWEPGSAVYNIATVKRLTGLLDRVVLEQSLNEIIRRHEILRTTFPMLEGEAVQKIAPALYLRLPVVDLANIAEPEREAEVQRLAQEEAHRSFDLAHGPLMRVCLLHVNETEHIFFFTSHHIVFDGWSSGVFYHELSLFYNAITRGTHPPLARLPIQYADYACWQRTWLQNEVLETQLTYWKQRLGDIPAVLELPTDRPRATIQTFQGAIYAFTIPQELSEGLKALSQQENVTLFMTLLAGFNALLSCYTGQQDIVVGTSIANRPREELEGLIGVFINTLVLRTDLTENPSFRALLARVREVALGAYDHQDLPFERLVNALRPERDLSRTPLFQVMFELQNTPRSSLELSGLTVTSLELTGKVALFDLTWIMVDTGHGLQGTIEYNTDLFYPTTIAHMAEDFQNLLQEATTNLDLPVSRLPLYRTGDPGLYRPDGSTEFSGRVDHQVKVRETTNGKVDRRQLPVPESAQAKLKQAFQSPLTPTEKKLAAIWSQVLGIEQIGIHDDFFELGGDSILSIRIIAKAQAAGLPFTPKQLFQHKTIAELAAQIREPELPAMLAEQGLVTGPVPLTPIQQWFFERDLPERHHYNQTMLLEIPHNQIDIFLLQQTVQALLTQHDALRLRYQLGAQGWEQNSAGLSSRVPFSFIDLTTYAETEQAAVFESIASELQASLKLASGVLLRVALFSFGADKPARLLIMIHHLAVDIISWQILLKDFQTAYAQLCRSEAIQLPRKTTAFKQWAEQVSVYAQSQSLRQELGYWLKQPWSAVTPLPVDSKGDNSEASSQSLSITLSIDETLALLREVPKIYHTQMSEVLLTALLIAMNRWTGKQTLLVELESHGREDIIENVDLSRTLGWFTSLVPVLLIAKTLEGGPGETLKAVKEQLRSIPNGRIGFGLLRYLNRDPLIKKQLQALPQAEVLFNYQGQAAQPVHNDTFFKPSYAFSGSPISLRGMRSHLLEIYGALKSGRLSITLRYSDKIHQRATIEHIAVLYREALQKIIASCQPSTPSKSTPSAFPKTNPTPKKLNTFNDPLPEIGSRRQNIEASYPLSPLQQGMLFQTLYDAAPGIYCIQLNLMIDGKLDTLAFRQAWQQLIQRHAILRTQFAWKDLEEPLQLSLQHFAMPWTEHDWQGLSESEQQAQLTHFLQEDRIRGFELMQSPPVRVTLFRLATANYRCVFSFHHIVLDGWSVPLLLNELLACYKAYSQGQQLELEPARPYRDYISWLQQQDQKQAELFWRQLLKGFTAPVALKIDQPLAKSTRHEASAERTVPFITFSAEMTAALRTLAQQQQLTVNTLVQGIWALLLSRYSREEDIVFGAAVAGRPAELADVETMVGMFVNTLPVRVQVSPQARLLPWLKELQMQQVEARQYEYMSLIQIKGLSDVPRELPLFESIVVFENYTSFAQMRKQSGQIQIKMEQNSGQSTYALYLEVGLGTNELSLRIIYDHQRFEAATVSRMLGHLQVVLESIVTNPQQRLGNLPILTADERRQILVEWQDTYAHYPQKLCLHQLFEAQARQTPAKIAVVYQDECLTYQELNHCANRLAHYLQKLGIGPEKRVGICVQRSLTMMICLLGVLKAGAAYVPLDPDYPSERLSFVFQNAQAQVLLTQQNLADRFSTQGAHSIAIDTSWEIITKEAQENLTSDVLPENLAYIIYTSGSTGRPKGVQIPHSAIVNLLSSMRHEPGLTEQDTLLAVTTFSFDMAGLDLFLPLIVGARLTLASQEMIGDAQLLCSQLATSGATVLQATPVTWRLLFEIGWQGDKELKALCGGEALPAALGKQLSECCASLWNMYGPTETTIWSAIRHIEVDSTPSIGRPIANTQIYLLDPSLQPVPVGVVGELYIGGSGLSRGYFNLPDLSAEKFIPDPFVGTSHDEAGSYSVSEPGARLYKTGDLARFLPDGQIDFLGRSDFQVKIRGFRIELGEIEAALSRHPAVDECVVVVHEKAPDHRQLVACVIAQPHQLPEVSSLRAFLSTLLPNYMIPAHFRLLEEFPLTPNGKLDRRALSSLTNEDEIEHSTRRARSRPRTILELQLIQIWENILQVHPISPDDNFFSIGGHSLLAARLMMQIQKQFGQTLPLSLLIQNGTVRHLAEILQQQTAIPVSPLVAIQPRGSRRPFFCVHPGSGNVLCYYELAHQLHIDQPFYGLQDPDIYRKDFPYIPVEATASRYITAIQAVQPAGPYLLGGYSFGGVVAFEMAQQLKRQGYSVALVAIIDGGTPGSSQSFKDDDDAAFLAVITMELTRGAAKKSLLELYEELQQYELAEQLQYVLEQMRLAGHEAPEGGPDWVYHEMQIFKMRSQAIQHYHPPVYEGRLTFFQSTEVDASGQLAPMNDDWQPFSTEPLETYLVPGYHDTILNDPHVQVLAEYMQNCLDKAQDLH